MSCKAPAIYDAWTDLASRRPPWPRLWKAGPRPRAFGRVSHACHQFFNRRHRNMHGTELRRAGRALVRPVRRKSYRHACTGSLRRRAASSKRGPRALSKPQVDLPSRHTSCPDRPSFHGSVSTEPAFLCRYSCTRINCAVVSGCVSRPALLNTVSCLIACPQPIPPGYLKFEVGLIRKWIAAVASAVDDFLNMRSR